MTPGALASSSRPESSAGWSTTRRRAPYGDAGDHVGSVGRLPGALVRVAGRVAQDEPERQRRGGRHDGQQQERGLDAAPPQVTHGEAADEQDSAHRPQSSSPTRAPSSPGGAAGQPGLVDEGAVAHRDQPVRGGRDPRVVGDDDQRLPGLVQALEEPEDVQGGGAVEVAGRLVGEDDQRFVAQRPGDRDPLPLAAGQRRGQEPRPVGEPDLLQQLLRPPPWPPAASARPAAPTARRSPRR